jgi:dienelactone hydrolase
VLALALLCGSASAESVPVSYASPDGFRIFAHYYRPDSASARAVVLLPDPAEGKERWTAVADSLRARGFHVLVPDLRGTGESATQRGLRRDRATFSRRERHDGIDARAALQYLRDLPATTIRAAAIVGSGEAAACALEARRADLPRVSCALVSPRTIEDGGVEPVPEIPTMVMIGRDDVLGLEAALRLTRVESTVETWLVDAAQAGSELLQSRLDLVDAWSHWIAHSLETSGG